MMKTTVAALAAAALFAVAGAAQAQTVVRIGHVAPTTGPNAHFGKDTENGTRLAIEDLNARHPKIGGKDVTFELMPEDDGGDPKQSTAAAQKLVDSGVVGVIGHLTSGTTIPASRIYSEAGIPEISPAATNPKYTEQGFRTAFRVVANDAHLGGTIGRYVVNDLKQKTIAVVDDRTAYGQGLADQFAKAATAAGAKIVAREYTTDRSTDFSAILTKIRSLKPDLVFFGGMDSVGGPMLRQMGQLGIDAKYAGGDGLCTTKFPELAGEAAGDHRVYCAEPGGITPEYAAEAERWHQRFEKRFGNRVNQHAPYAYDAMMAIGDAMVRADSTQPARYLPALAKTSMKGITGPIAFDDKGDIKGGTLTLYTFKDGKRERISVIQ